MEASRGMHWQMMLEGTINGIAIHMEFGVWLVAWRFHWIEHFPRQQQFEWGRMSKLLINSRAYIAHDRLGEQSGIVDWCGFPSHVV